VSPCLQSLCLVPKCRSAFLRRCECPGRQNIAVPLTRLVTTAAGFAERKRELYIQTMQIVQYNCYLWSAESISGFIKQLGPQNTAEHSGPSWAEPVALTPSSATGSLFWCCLRNVRHQCLYLCARLQPSPHVYKLSSSLLALFHPNFSLPSKPIKKQENVFNKSHIMSVTKIYSHVPCDTVKLHYEVAY
jgi:hypothetical protein